MVASGYVAARFLPILVQTRRERAVGPGGPNTTV